MLFAFIFFDLLITFSDWEVYFLTELSVELDKFDLALTGTRLELYSKSAGLFKHALFSFDQD